MKTVGEHLEAVYNGDEKCLFRDVCNPISCGGPDGYCVEMDYDMELEHALHAANIKMENDYLFYLRYELLPELENKLKKQKSIEMKYISKLFFGAEIITIRRLKKAISSLIKLQSLFGAVSIASSMWLEFDPNSKEISYNLTRAEYIKQKYGGEVARLYTDLEQKENELKIKKKEKRKEMILQRDERPKIVSLKAEIENIKIKIKA